MLKRKGYPRYQPSHLLSQGGHFLPRIDSMVLAMPRFVNCGEDVILGEKGPRAAEGAAVRPQSHMRILGPRRSMSTSEAGGAVDDTAAACKGRAHRCGPGPGREPFCGLPYNNLNRVQV